MRKGHIFSFFPFLPEKDWLYRTWIYCYIIEIQYRKKNRHCTCAFFGHIFAIPCGIYLKDLNRLLRQRLARQKKSDQTSRSLEIKIYITAAFKWGFCWLPLVDVCTQRTYIVTTYIFRGCFLLLLNHSVGNEHMKLHTKNSSLIRCICISIGNIFVSPSIRFSMTKIEAF